MAETNRLETRILLRYATYSQWMNSDLILLPGEAAVAAFPRASTINNTDDTLNVFVTNNRDFSNEQTTITTHFKTFEKNAPLTNKILCF